MESTSKTGRVAPQIPNLMIAPMVGISHVAFREWARLFLPEEIPVWVFTEMLSSRRVPSQNLQFSKHLQITDDERNGWPWIPQLLINEKRFVKPSIEKLCALGPSGIDINMGCPVKHTLKHNWGVRLMGDPDYAASVVRWCRSEYDGPLSVKMRLIRTKESTKDYMHRFLTSLREAGADWVTIHARFKENKHAGKAEWQLLQDIRQRIEMPVVANGAVSDTADLNFLLDELELDGVMLARVVLAKPWIFWAYFSDKFPDKTFGIKAKNLGFTLPKSSHDKGTFYLNALVAFAQSVENWFELDKERMERLLFFVTMSHKWFDFGHAFWKGLKSKHSWHDYKEYLRAYAAKEPLSLLKTSPIQ